MRIRFLQTPVALALTGLWGFAVYYGHMHDHLQFLDRIEGALTDFRMHVRGIKPPPDLVTIVAIDDALVTQKGFPVARTDLAKILDTIAHLEPRAIAIDILLTDPGSDEGDETLARSLNARRTVIASAAVFGDLGMSIVDNDGTALARLPRAEKFILPLAKFAEQADVGVVNVATDQDGSPRAIPMIFRTRNMVELSFPLRAASLAVGSAPVIEPDRLVLGERTIPADIDYALPLTFYGPRRTIRTISAASVLHNDIAPEDIRNRIVVVGSTVTGAGDFFPTPFDRVMPGVEVISTAITHLMAGDGPVRNRAVRIANGIVAVVLPMALVGLLAWRRSTGLIAMMALIVVWAGANLFAFLNGVWLSAAVPIVAAVPPVLAFGALQLWSGRRRAQYFAARSELLEEFQSPGIQQWLTEDPDFLREPVHQDAAVVFIDLSNFTLLSERVGPDATRELLKEFHALIDRDAVSHGGTITSFQGDGAMILFGLPKPATDDASQAADCAVALASTTTGWLASLSSSIASQLGFKIGAHFGEIVASRLGGESYHHITATGDTVNVASRLMEVAAANDVAVALSDGLMTAAGRHCAAFMTGALTGPIETHLRGRAGEMRVWLWWG